MLSRVEKALSAINLTNEKPLVVGVSGGADSLCLLHLLAQLSFPLVAAHLDHGLRVESGDDADFVREYANEMELPVQVQRVNVAEFAKHHKQSIEEAAREVRYMFLYQQAQENDAQAVLVAHHADDQAESMLMHLLRGAGLAGLKGMQVVSYNPEWSDDIPLVRPLLSVWREEILAYCEEHQIKPRFDRSNLDTTYFRNRLRHELIPTLEEYNPNVRQTLWRTASTLAADYEALHRLVHQAWRDCEITTETDCVRIKRGPFSQRSLGIQRGLVREAISKLRPGLRDIGFDAVERALAFAAEPPHSGQADLVDGLKLELDGDWLLIMEWEARPWRPAWPLVQDNRSLQIPGSVSLPNGWSLDVKLIPVEPKVLEQARNNTDPYQAWLDADHIQGQVAVRPWRVGERFSPLGMAGKTMKVGDFFINVKMPARARQHWPLVVDAEGVLWIPGYRLAHRVRLTETSSQAVKLKLLRN